MHVFKVLPENGKTSSWSKKITPSQSNMQWVFRVMEDKYFLSKNLMNQELILLLCISSQSIFWIWNAQWHILILISFHVWMTLAYFLFKSREQEDCIWLKTIIILSPGGLILIILELKVQFKICSLNLFLAQKKLKPWIYF